MTLPVLKTVYEAIDVTWPAVRTALVGPWVVRTGDGGGSRVSATTLAYETFTEEDLERAEAEMRSLDQTPLFMIQQGQNALDQSLIHRNYARKDPSNLYAIDVNVLIDTPIPPLTAIESWPPLAAQCDIWDAGGIGPARRNIMERAKQPRTTFLGRINDRPAASVYIGVHQSTAMLHALEIAPHSRRLGLGRYMVAMCAHWAKAQGCTSLCLLTTQANEAANALYASMGFSLVGEYHYRIAPEAP